MCGATSWKVGIHDKKKGPRTEPFLKADLSEP